MAKYEVNYSCGHKATIQLFGKVDDRFKKIAWLEKEGMCEECYRTYQRKIIQEKDSKWTILPTIEGVSEKQIEYARKLRLDAVDSCGKIPFKAMQEKGLSDIQIEGFKSQLENGTDEFKRSWRQVALLWETNASKIIEICK